MYHLRKLLDQIQSMASPFFKWFIPPVEHEQLDITCPGIPTRHVPLDKKYLTIGRSRQNNIVLKGSNISRQHARLRQTTEGWQVENLANTSGTRLSGRELQPNSPQIWLPNQPLQIATYTLHWSWPTNTPAVPISSTSHADISPPKSSDNSRVALLGSTWPFLAIILIFIWLLVLLRVPVLLPSLLASCLTFIALLITPGFLLADMITWRLGLDKLEQLALALPLGIAILALPGMVSLLLHLTLTILVLSWFIISAVLIAAWLLARGGAPLFGRLFRDAPSLPVRTPRHWTADELILLFCLVILFVLILPTLSLYKIDGDAYAVNTFAVDALAGLPLNAREPLFGTDLGPGVRMVFNQYLPLSYLWSYLAGMDTITLMSLFSRQILALWAILAIYMLGKAAGAGSRRFGLFTAAIQLLIYMAAPFWRGDNVSFYFFERINADKFMVMVLLLPPCFALAIRYLRNGRLDVWVAAAVVAFATSTIHPLGAAMLALAVSAFGGCHILLNIRHRLAQRRSLGLFALTAVVMLLPILQLFLARGEAPLASSYPDSFDGWSIGEKMVPILPFTNIRGLDLYGPLPELGQLEASQANTTKNPFLIWRFAVNMNRQRLIVFDANHFISDPRLLLEPPYLLLLLLLPFLIKHIRANLAVQFAVSTTLVVLFVMFNPVVTPLIGSLVMPWILWRLVWLLPYALVIALAAQQLLATIAKMTRLSAERESALRRWLGTKMANQIERTQGPYLLPALILIITLLASPTIMSHLRYLHDDSFSSYFYPTPQRIFDRLNILTSPDKPAMVLADQDLSVTVAAYVASANILAHRVPTTSEIFPANQQDLALQRLIDQNAFFRTPYLTADSIDILSRYRVKFVITSSGSDLDLQLQLAPQWFKWQLDDQSYSLYTVVDVPSQAAVAIQGNNALAKRDLATAETLYKTALIRDTGDLIALAGLAKIAQEQGQYDQALSRWHQALARADLPILHARLGLLYALRADFERSGAEWEQASRQAPNVVRYHVGLGDVCLRNGMDSCAEEQYAAAASQQGLPNQATHLMVEANLWQQQGRFDYALPLYEKAVTIQPVRFNQYILESAYREAGKPEQSAALLQRLIKKNPFSAELAIVTANMLTTVNHIDEAIDLYRRAILLEKLQAQDTVDTRLDLAQLLLDSGRLTEAGQEVEKTLALSPYSGEAYRLKGDLYRLQGKFDLATVAYQQAFKLDPTLVTTYISLNNQLRQDNGRPEDWLRILQLAVGRNPNESSLYFALGDQWQQQGDRKAAINAYLSALENLDRDTLSGQFLPPSTRQGRAFIYSRLARIYEDQGQTIPALNFYQAMVAVAPDVSWVHIVLGDVWRRQNNIIAAETLYRQALQVDPAYLIAYLRLAEVNEARGDNDEAASLRQQAIQLAESQLAQPLQDQDLSQLGKRSLSSTLPIFSDNASPSASTVIDNGDKLIQQMQSVEAQATTLDLLTHLYRLSGQGDKAIRLYQSMLAQSEQSGSSPALQAQYRKGLGDLYLAQGKLDLAKDAYQQAIALDQWSMEARLGLAMALTTEGDREAAVTQLQKAVELAPGVTEVRLALANILAQQGRITEARDIYEATAQDYPNSVQAKQSLAEFYISHKQPRDALPLFQEALIRDPGNTKLYLALSQLWLTQGEAARAQAVLESGLDVVSDTTELTTALSTLFLQQNEPEKALAILMQGIGREGENTPLLMALGTYYISRANYDQAAKWYEHAQAADPNSAAIQVAIADLDSHVDNASDALEHYERAVDLAPTAPGYWLTLANAYQSSERYAEAIEAYSKTLALDPDLTVAYTGLAEVWRTQDQWDKAQSIYEQGLAAQPTSAWLMSAYADFLFDRGDKTQALALVQRGTEVAQDVPTMVALAALYQQMGNTESSEVLLQSALAQEPGSIVALIALGDLYEEQGRTSDAQLIFEKTVALTPGLSTGYLRLGNLANEAGDQAVADHYAALAQQVAPGSFGP